MLAGALYSFGNVMQEYESPQAELFCLVGLDCPWASKFTGVRIGAPGAAWTYPMPRVGTNHLALCSVVGKNPQTRAVTEETFNSE